MKEKTKSQTNTCHAGERNYDQDKRNYVCSLATPFAVTAVRTEVANVITIKANVITIEANVIRIKANVIAFDPSAIVLVADAVAAAIDKSAFIREALLFHA